jgi:hypothetical protein
LAGALALCSSLPQNFRFAAEGLPETGSDSEALPLGVVDDNSKKMLPLPKPGDGELELPSRRLVRVEIRFDSIGEIFAENFRPMLQIATQIPLLRTHLIIREAERDQGDPNDQRNRKAKGEKAHK